LSAASVLCTILDFVSFGKDFETVANALQQGLDPNQQGNQGFRLHCCLRLGSLGRSFLDEVGQTLLNWASAFGSLEIVQVI
jgi:hypothetical protein